MRNGLGAPPVFRGRFYNSGARTRRKSPFRGVDGLSSQWMMKGQVNGMLGWLTRLSGMSRRGASLNGLGTGPTDQELELFLDHSRVPRIGGTAKRIPQIATIAEAKKYASNGFHVSVDQGLQAKDRSVKLLWARAAYAYWAVYNATTEGVVDPVTKLKQGLQAADQIADTARLATRVAAVGEGKPAPTPAPSPTAPMTVGIGAKKKSRMGLWIGLAAAGVIGGALLLSSKKRRRAA